MKKTSWDRVEQEDQIRAEQKGSEQEERTRVIILELSYQYITMKVKRSNKTISEKSESERS